MLTSVELQVTSEYPATFLWCGDMDKTVDIRNSATMAATLAENGVPHEIRTYPAVGHGVGLGRGLSCEDWLNSAISFWEMHHSQD